MLRIENENEIHISRGDDFSIDFIIPLCGSQRYMFNVGDKLTFDVYEKKGYDKCSLLHKEVIIDKPIDVVTFDFTNEDTTIGELINKPVDYWYEIQYIDGAKGTTETVLGYDDDGEKIFKLYPEGSNKICPKLEEED